MSNKKHQVSQIIQDVYIRTRPGADTSISDSLMVDVGDVITDAGLGRLWDENDITQNTLILALGGDGTMLSALHLASRKSSFVSGFNYGNLGYLVPDAARSNRELVDKLGNLLSDITLTEKNRKSYNVVEYKLPTLTQKENTAINDFYFVPAANGSAADFTVTIGSAGSNFTTKSSGMVVSTPLGSTGLALSAGGSILSPNSHVLEVVPMMPHTLTSRPIIAPDTDVIAVSWDKPVAVFADGKMISVDNGNTFIIKCRKRKINLVQPTNWDFFENLKHKMNWHS